MCVKLMKAKLGPDHPDTLTSMGNLAKTYFDVKQPEKALPLFEDFVTGQRKRLGADTSRFADLLERVGFELLKAHQFAHTEELLCECLAIREKTQPDAWTTFNTQSMLGGALLGQQKYAEAEPLLLAGYGGMKQREKTIPAQGKVRIPEAIERLVQLYEAMDKKDEAAKWRKELEAAKAKEEAKDQNR
jgi:hypothetical protein